MPSQVYGCMSCSYLGGRFASDEIGRVGAGGLRDGANDQEVMSDSPVPVVNAGSSSKYL